METVRNCDKRDWFLPLVRYPEFLSLPVADCYHTMHWLYLILAILSEVAGTTCMKLSAGFTKLTPSVLMWVFYAVCFYFLTLTLRKVDVSVSYAIWSGVGTALIALIGVFFFREPVSVLKIAGIVAIIGGVIALNISGGTH